MIEKRSHVGGNSFSEIDSETGIEYHKYGSHIFHTSNSKVWEYANRFTKFNDYTHFVYTNSDNKIYSMPINLLTINNFFNRDFTPSSAKEFLIAGRATAKKAANLEENAIAQIGRPLYEALIKGYTWKQWQTDPSQLPAEIINRLPVRFNYNQRYFSDKWEGIPLEGYSTWINRMLDSNLVDVALNVDFFDVKNLLDSNQIIIYSGPIDRFFNYRYGSLSWRTLDFEFERLNVNDFQGTSVLNYADLGVPFTRIHEFKHLHPERDYKIGNTLIAREFSRFANNGDEPYYPINSANDRNRLKKYRGLASNLPNIFFGGRLGSYKYLDMHMAIASALTLFENKLMDRILELRV